MKKDLVYNATLRRKYGEYASFMENIYRNNWRLNDYSSIIWGSLLTIALVGLWCKVMLIRLEPRITAYPTVAFTSAVRALDGKEIAHKLKIFLGTVGSMTILVVITFLILLFFCCRK
jgi:cobalamin biosynthesis protein CobD/CbiB